MDIVSFFDSFGILGMGIILMLETAFLPLFFLPGDTLIFTTGYLVQLGKINFFVALFILSMGAFFGNIIAYYIGVFFQKPIFRFINSQGEYLVKNINRTHDFYEKYGWFTLFIARFIPSIRAIAPFLAGVVKMSFKKFLIISFFTGIFWSFIGLSLGMIFGNTFSNMEKILWIVLIASFVVAVTPILAIFYNKIKIKYKKSNEVNK